MNEEKGCKRILQMLKIEVAEGLKREEIKGCDEIGYVVEIKTKRIGDIPKILKLHGYENRWSMTADESGEFVLWKIVPNPENLWDGDHKLGE